MSDYLVDKFKGKYRIMNVLDQRTNNPPRDNKGKISDIDNYIKCQNNIKIFHYGHNILQAYIPSIGVGRNIIKKIYADYINKDNVTITSKTIVNKNNKESERSNIKILDTKLFESDLKSNNYIFDVEETDEEVLFKFKYEMMEQLVQYFNPCIKGAMFSPNSSKNMVKSDLKIPDDKLQAYKEAVKNLGDNSMIIIGNIAKDFMKKFATKKKPLSEINSERKKLGMDNKQYFYHIGKFDDYIENIKSYKANI